MDLIRTPRRLLPLLLVVAGGLAACDTKDDGRGDTDAPVDTDAGGDTDDTDEGETDAPTPITTDFELRTALRELWTAHATWTRVFLTSAIADLPDLDAATTRLLRNQDDLGDAIRPFYGDAAGDQLTSLLHDHITIAADLVAAAKAGDEEAVDDANGRWSDNAADIAAFLAGANPAWDEAALRSMMLAHLGQTVAEATARLTGDWEADVDAHDAVVHHLLMMSDTLADGIAQQFPGLVATSERSEADRALHVELRELWEDHVTWTRAYVTADIAELPDASAAAGRLLENQDAIGAAVVPFYGEEGGDQLATLLREHITDAVTLLDAVEAGDDAATTAASDAWYANADAIAAFLADANPAWDEATLQTAMHGHLDQTLAEASARLEGRWDDDVEAYDMVVMHILSMADVLADGVVEQFPAQF
jgi:hypothetical protein